MANREQGEASFNIGETVYRLKIDMYAWAWAQDALSKGAKVPAIEMLTARLSANHTMTILAVFGGAMQKHHEHDVPDLKKATELFVKSNGAAADALAKAISRSAPDAEDLKELGVTPNPPQAQGDKKVKAGVGDASESKPAEPA